MAIAVLLAGVWKLVPRPASSPAAPSYTSGHAALLATYGDELPVEPRLSAAGSSRRDVGTPGPSQGLHFAGDGLEARLRAEALIEREQAVHPSPESHAALGVRRLLAGNAEGAIGALEVARLARPEDPRILNDLAAAHLLLGEGEGRGTGFITALSLALKAVELDRDGPEWKFNLALALEALHLELAAREAWESFLELDSTTAWAKSARRHLEAFDRETRWRGSEKAALRLQELDEEPSEEWILDLSRSFPESLLHFAERELLGSWARAVSREDRSSAAASLERLQRIAGALSSSGGAGPLEQTVSWISELAGPREEQRFAQAYLGLLQGVASYEQFELDAAEGALRSAYDELSRWHSPYALRARLYLALCLYQRAQYEEALKLFAEVIDAARTMPDPFVLGYAHHGSGSTLYSLQLPLEALVQYEDALGSYLSAGWKGRAAGIESLIAEVRSSLGQDEQAWEHRIRALENSGWISDPRTRIRAWSEATRSVERLGGPEAARFFADELVRIADSEDEAILKAIALRQRAAVLHASGDRAEALADLSAAAEWIDQIRDLTVAEMARVDLVLVRGELLAEDDPTLALATLEEARRLAETTRYTSMFPKLLHARSRAHRALGAVREAEADLDAALGKVEVALGRLPNVVARMAYAGQVRGLYDEALALADERGRAGPGLIYSEQLRRSLLTRDGVDIAGALEAVEVVPPSVAVLVFHVLPDRLLVWILRSDGLKLVRLPVGAEKLTAQVRVFRRSLTSGEQWNPIAEELFDELLATLGEDLAGVESLVLIPDGALHALPFGALIDRRSDRFLVEEFRISTSPLLSIALKGLRGVPSGGFDASTTVLAIANPWQPRSAATLPDLTYAETEVERLAKFFPRTSVLKRRAATKARFLEEARTSSVIHFAGHAELNPRLPLLSNMILSPGNDGAAGRLYVYELLEQRLETPRLVVFSACNSRAGGPAFASLADAAVAAGVPIAVGSLWSIADRPTADFFERFYEEIRMDGDAIDALRRTQLYLLRSSDPELSHPRFWAAFQASGVAHVAPEE